MNNKAVMGMVYELEAMASVCRRQAGYKRFSKGIKTRKLGIAHGLTIAADKLRGIVVPSLKIMSDEEIERLGEMK